MTTKLDSRVLDLASLSLSLLHTCVPPPPRLLPIHYIWSTTVTGVTSQPGAHFWSSCLCFGVPNPRRVIWLTSLILSCHVMLQVKGHSRKPFGVRVHCRTMGSWNLTLSPQGLVGIPPGGAVRGRRLREPVPFVWGWQGSRGWRRCLSPAQELDS